MTQAEFILSYYKKYPNKDIPHQEVVDWATEAYRKETGKVLRDADRAIRKLHQAGQLMKIAKGLYRYDPDQIKNPQLEDFSEKDKQTILKRDGYQCVICRNGRQEGIELQVDHIKPKDRGGKAEILNGQTLCAEHNFRKKNYGQTESGKKMFIRLLELAKKEGDTKTVVFCEAILATFDEHDVNGHIEWKK